MKSVLLKSSFQIRPEAMADNQVYDVVIVGLGPAGVTAAVYSYRNNFNTLLIGESFGGAMLVSGEIENWPGLINTNGFEMAEKLEAQVKHYCKDNSCYQAGTVSSITKEGELFRVTDSNNNSVLSKTVVYAAGSRSRKLNVPGEEEYRNRGVTYCATCDGPLFRNKEVIVVGGGNSAMKSVMMLRKIASKITMVTINPDLQGEQISIDAVKKVSAENPDLLRIVYNGQTKEIKGNGTFVSGIVVEELKTKQAEEIAAQGVFVEIGLIPITDPIKSLGLKMNQIGEIETDRNMNTNVPGFFVAGDVSDIRDKQIIVAAGSGSVAALSAAEYLAKGA